MLLAMCMAFDVEKCVWLFGLELELRDGCPTR